MKSILHVKLPAMNNNSMYLTGILQNHESPLSTSKWHKFFVRIGYIAKPIAGFIFSTIILPFTLLLCFKGVRQLLHTRLYPENPNSPKDNVLGKSFYCEHGKYDQFTGKDYADRIITQIKACDTNTFPTTLRLYGHCFGAAKLVEALPQILNKIGGEDNSNLKAITCIDLDLDRTFTSVSSTLLHNGMIWFIPIAYLLGYSPNVIDTLKNIEKPDNIDLNINILDSKYDDTLLGAKLTGTKLEGKMKSGINIHSKTVDNSHMGNSYFHNLKRHTAIEAHEISNTQPTATSGDLETNTCLVSRDQNTTSLQHSPTNTKPEIPSGQSPNPP